SYLRQAGAKAFGRSANREAVAYFEQALTVLSHLPETREGRSRPSTFARARQRPVPSCGIRQDRGVSPGSRAPGPEARRSAAARLGVGLTSDDETALRLGGLDEIEGPGRGLAGLLIDQRHRERLLDGDYRSGAADGPPRVATHSTATIKDAQSSKT